MAPSGFSVAQSVSNCEGLSTPLLLTTVVTYSCESNLQPLGRKFDDINVKVNVNVDLYSASS